jgi:hypothetical protein
MFTTHNKGKALLIQTYGCVGTVKLKSFCTKPRSYCTIYRLTNPAKNIEYSLTVGLTPSDEVSFPPSVMQITMAGSR